MILALRVIALVSLVIFIGLVAAGIGADVALIRSLIAFVVLAVLVRTSISLAQFIRGSAEMENNEQEAREKVTGKQEGQGRQSSAAQRSANSGDEKSGSGSAEARREKASEEEGGQPQASGGHTSNEGESQEQGQESSERREQKRKKEVEEAERQAQKEAYKDITQVKT